MVEKNKKFVYFVSFVYGSGGLGFGNTEFYLTERLSRYDQIQEIERQIAERKTSSFQKPRVLYYQLLREE